MWPLSQSSLLQGYYGYNQWTPFIWSFYQIQHQSLRCTQGTTQHQSPGPNSLALNIRLKNRLKIRPKIRSSSKTGLKWVFKWIFEWFFQGGSIVSAQKCPPLYTGENQLRKSSRNVTQPRNLILRLVCIVLYYW